MKSDKMSLNSTDWFNIAHSAVVFLAPLALLYLAQVTGVLQTVGHEFSLRDLQPSSFTLGATVLYIANRLTDILRKFVV